MNNIKDSGTQGSFNFQKPKRAFANAVFSNIGNIFEQIEEWRKKWNVRDNIGKDL